MDWMDKRCGRSELVFLDLHQKLFRGSLSWQSSGNAALLCPKVLHMSWLLFMVSVKLLYHSEHQLLSSKWRKQHPKIPLGLKVCESIKKTVMSVLDADDAMALTSSLLPVRGCRFVDMCLFNYEDVPIVREALKRPFTIPPRRAE